MRIAFSCVGGLEGWMDSRSAWGEEKARYTLNEILDIIDGFGGGEGGLSSSEIQRKGTRKIPEIVWWEKHSSISKTFRLSFLNRREQDTPTKCFIHSVRGSTIFAS